MANNQYNFECNRSEITVQTLRKSHDGEGAIVTGITMVYIFRDRKTDWAPLWRGESSFPKRKESATKGIGLEHTF